MGNVLKYIFRAALFLFVQVFILDHVRIHQMVTPYIYFLFIIWLPFRTSRAALMFIAFLFGFALDSFRHNPGFHAAACVLIAYLRPFLVSIFIPQEGSDSNFDEPSPRSLGGFMPYLIFTGILCLLHNAWLFLLEAWQFGNIWYFLVKTVLSTAISMLLVLITELLFARKQKFRTNTV